MIMADSSKTRRTRMDIECSAASQPKHIVSLDIDWCVRLWRQNGPKSLTRTEGLVYDFATSVFTTSLFPTPSGATQQHRGDHLRMLGLDLSLMSPEEAFQGGITGLAARFAEKRLRDGCGLDRCEVGVRAREASWRRLSWKTWHFRPFFTRQHHRLERR